jgi:hypothetical protein
MWQRDLNGWLLVGRQTLVPLALKMACKGRAQMQSRVSVVQRHGMRRVASLLQLEVGVHHLVASMQQLLEAQQVVVVALSSSSLDHGIHLGNGNPRHGPLD